MNNFVIDVDGVLTTTELIYSKKGKIFKTFGPDDHDALNILRQYMKIIFVTGDKRGFDITKRRIDEMKFELLLLHPTERIDWIVNNLDTKNTIYMGDGIFDSLVFKHVAYSICPNDGFYLTKEKADFVTRHDGGKRAVAEACVHILEKFFGINDLKFNKNYGIWGEKNK